MWANAYRFSIGIPRVIPTPDGKPNQKGLDFYSRIVDRLLEYGIAPIVTLYHWDLPQYMASEDGREGGWLERETAYKIADYAGIVAKCLGDRVHTYTTLNEPWCATYLSYGGTEQAPARRRSARVPHRAPHQPRAWPHVLRPCAPRRAASQSFRSRNLQVCRGDADAVHRLDLIANRAFLDPMLRGRYPQELFAITKGICDWDFIRDGDLALINQPVDVLGLNYYSTNLVKMSDRPQFPQGAEASAAPGASDIDWLPTAGPHTEMGWNIDPDALYETLVRLNDNYPGMPLVVTENGMACPDKVEVGSDGVKMVHDNDRIDYLRRHLEAVYRAIEEGTDVRGYFAWSLMDNFEWAFGYSKRFGLTYVDYESQERIKKDSFEWYRRFIAEHSAH